jgi:hypothetical protein
MITFRPQTTKRQAPRRAIAAKSIPACRSFTLLDAMILVAATAIGLALANAVADFRRLPLARSSPNIYVCLPSLATWSIAALVLRLRHPRPTLRRIVRQPGATSTITTCLIIITGTLLALVSRLTRIVIIRQDWLRVPTQGDVFLLILVTAVVVGAAITAAWANLAISGRRRPERGWLDGLGRLIGTVWVVLGWMVLGVFFLRW